MGASSRGQKRVKRKLQERPRKRVRVAECLYTCKVLFTPSLSRRSPRQDYDPVWAGGGRKRPVSTIKWWVFPGYCKTSNTWCIHLPPCRSPQQPGRCSLSWGAPAPSLAACGPHSRGQVSPDPQTPLLSRLPGPLDPGVRHHLDPGWGRRPRHLGSGALSRERTERAPPRSRGSCSARPNRKAPSGGRGARRAAGPSRPRRARRGGGPGERAVAVASAGSNSHRVLVLVRSGPGQQQQQPQRGGRRHAGSARQRPHPPRSHRPGAGPPTPPPPPLPPPPPRPIRIHGARTDARGPGPSLWLLRAAAVTARSEAFPASRRLLASSSDSATSSGHPGTRRKCLAMRGRNRRRPPRPRGTTPAAPEDRARACPPAGRPWVAGEAARTVAPASRPSRVPGPRRRA